MSAATRRAPVLVLAGGLVAGIVVALALGTSASDTAALVALGGGGALAVAAVTVAVLARSSHRSMAAHVVVVALAAVATTAAGVGLAAWFMFFSSHDLGVLATVLVLSASVAASAALVLGRSFRRGVDVVTHQIEALASDDAGTGRVDGLVTGEVQRLSQLLESAHRELIDARARAARLDASRRELISWVSHDLRSPIGAVRAMAEALEDGVVTDYDDVAGYHRAIRREAERFAELVDDLFELARIEAGVATVDVPYVPLHELVGELVEAAAVRASSADVRLLPELDDVGSELVVAADIRRALANVLDNAIRHTPAGGTVVVRGSTDGSGAVLVVRDECGGIPPEDLERIFDVAFRGDLARSRDTGGGGLGLAIAKGLVEARDGRISVRNDADGCEFTVVLPGRT